MASEDSEMGTAYEGPGTVPGPFVKYFCEKAVH